MNSRKGYGEGINSQTGLCVSHDFEKEIGEGLFEKIVLERLDSLVYIYDIYNYSRIIIPKRGGVIYKLLLFIINILIKK